MFRTDAAATPSSREHKDPYALLHRRGPSAEEPEAQVRSIAEVAKEQGNHPIDVMLDISVEEDLKAEFAMADFINNDEEALAQIIKHPLTLLGASDGGAHTKFLTLGRYPTHFLAHW